MYNTFDHGSHLKTTRTSPVNQPVLGGHWRRKAGHVGLPRRCTKLDHPTPEFLLCTRNSTFSLWTKPLLIGCSFFLTCSQKHHKWYTAQTPSCWKTINLFPNSFFLSFWQFGNSALLFSVITDHLYTLHPYNSPLGRRYLLFVDGNTSLWNDWV